VQLLANLATGFATALSLQNLFYCFLGVFVGTAIGVLPGLGPIATIAMLLPMTYALEPVTALIMLAGIYYGAQYGGSTTAILVNLPGESSSVVTCLDGYQMALRGRAGAALAIAALGSFFAGSVATLLIAGFSPILSTVAYLFGPAEYFALMVLGLVGAVALTDSSLLKSFAMVALGMAFGLVGIDVNSGQYRFTIGVTQLVDGIEFVAVAMGLFAVTDIMVNAAPQSDLRLVTNRIDGLLPSKDELRQAWPAVVRGTAVGSVLGLLPGGGAMLASFASYTLEKRIARHPEQFGQGAVAGVAGPESANNAGAQTSFIPMLTLGIPSNGVMALMMGAMMIHNIQPGPQVMLSNPSLFWGLIASMWIGNLMLLILNLPLIGLWVKLVAVPYRILYPSILVVCVIGLFSIHNQVFEIFLMAFFGVLGYLFYRMQCPPVPLLLGFILGPIMEKNLRTALVLSFGDPAVFVTRPLSAAMLLAAFLLLALVLLPAIRRRKSEIFAESSR